MSAPLQEELDRSFGDGPAQRPIEEAVRGGRRRLLRIRAGGAAASLAMVVGAGLGYAAIASPAPGGGAGVAVQPTPTSTPLPTDAEHEFAPDEGPIALTTEGVALREGATIVEQVANPMGYEPPSQSLGAVVEHDRELTWWLLTIESDDEGRPTSAAALTGGPGGEFATFEAWLDDIVAQQQDEAGGAWSEPVSAPPASYADDGSLLLAEGVDVLDRIDDPVDPGRAKGFDSVALDLEQDGRRLWILLQTDRQGGSSVQDDAFATHGSFEDWVADQVAVTQRSAA